MRKTYKIKNKKNLLLILIILLAIFMRFYRIHDFLFWGMDQEYEAFLVKNIVAGKHFPLIGVNASNTGLYLGPAFIYFAAIPFALSGGNPLGWAITASVLGVITVIAVLAIGKRFFGIQAGFLAALIYAGSFLVSFYDREFWNPVFIPLLSLLIGYFIYEILVGHTSKLILLALTFGLGLHSHLSLLVFIPLISAVIWKKRKSIHPKVAVYSVIAFIFTQIPVILFDFRHNFINIRAAGQLVLNWGTLSGYGSSIVARVTLIVSTLGRYFFPSVSSDWFVESGQCKELISYRKENLVTGLNLIIGALSIIWLVRKKLIKRLYLRSLLKIRNIRGEKFIISVLILTAVFVAVYPREIFEYYLLFFFPWLAIISGYILQRLLDYRGGKIFVSGLLSFFMIINLSALLTSSSSFSYKDKITALEFSGNYLKNSSYSLEALGECPRFGGYRYLSEYVIGKPVSSYLDSYFSWLYPESISPVNPDKILLLSLIDSRMPQNKISQWQGVKLNFLNENKLIEQRRFGDLKVYLLTPGKYK